MISIIIVRKIYISCLKIRNCIRCLQFILLNKNYFPDFKSLVIQTKLTYLITIWNAKNFFCTVFSWKKRNLKEHFSFVILLSIGKVSSTIIFILVCSWRLVSMSVYHHWLCFSSQTEIILYCTMYVRTSLIKQIKANISCRLTIEHEKCIFISRKKDLNSATNKIRFQF